MTWVITMTLSWHGCQNHDTGMTLPLRMVFVEF